MPALRGPGVVFIFELFLAAVHAIIWRAQGPSERAGALGVGWGSLCQAPRVLWRRSSGGGGEITGGIKMCKL